MAPVILGAIAVALFGHLSYPMVVLVLETSRFGCIITLGAFNASYIVQFITIFDHSWINSFEDRQVILASVVCSVLHYTFYLPDLVTVRFGIYCIHFNLYFFQKCVWSLSFLTKGPFSEFFGGSALLSQLENTAEEPRY